MSDRPQRGQHSFTRAPQHPMRDRLPELAAALARGGAAVEPYAELIAHMRDCAECQVELDDLLELLEPVYDAGLEPAGGYPPVNLSFLRNEPAPAGSRPLGAERLTISFANLPLHTIRQPALAGAARGQLLYRYIQEPGSVADLRVTIEIFAEDAAREAGRVRVTVDIPSRDPLSQSGSRVLLHAGDLELAADTDETGTVDFAPVPLATLPQLRVEIAPSEEPV